MIWDGEIRVIMATSNFNTTLRSNGKDDIQFDRFYAASAVCSPTRASFLTGRNPYRTESFQPTEVF